MFVIAIDPGPEEAAYVLWDGKQIESFGNLPNSEMLEYLQKRKDLIEYACAIEQIRGFGVMASDGLFDTCHWTGRFLQAFGEHRTHMIPRKKAAAHVCGTGGISKDAFVREAIISKFGGKDVAIGNKKNPGKLYGISSHLWAALAVALTYWDTIRVQPGPAADGW